MNAAITTTGTRTWKLVKAHYLAAALGAVLAFSAVAGADSLRNVDFGGSSSQATAPAAVSVIHLAPAKATTVYIVGSQAQADLMIFGTGQASTVGAPPASSSPSKVFVVDSPESESALNFAINEASLAGSDTRFVDLRSR